MKISLHWLQKYINLSKISPEEIAQKLTFSGLEVEGIEFQNKGLEGVRVGEIKEISPHPNADRLQLTKVDVGSGELLDIVCGAKNIQCGQKIPVATIGSILPNGLKIKASSIRGSSSHGMLCSPEELKLNVEEIDGIYILDPKAPVGKSFSDYMGLNDIIFDISVTPNRGDALSHLGIARELSILFQIPYSLKEPKAQKRKTSMPLSIDNQIGDDCPAYFACYVKNIKINPSPPWLQNHLKAVGLRSINAVVDISSFVMMELGQPIHIFDGDTMTDNGGIRITIRDAKKGENFSTISHKSLRLSEKDIVIAGGEKGDISAALGGVMGSSNTEVGEHTQNILIESAEFCSKRVRGTSQRHSLPTDAAYRFERNIDSQKISWAIQRAIDLIEELTGGQAQAIVSSQNAKKHLGRSPVTVTYSQEQLERTLGTSPEKKEIKKILSSLEMDVKSGRNGKWEVAIPSWRHDIRIAENITEEIVRIWGFENLDSKLPLVPAKVKKNIIYQDQHIYKFRELLCGLGFFEALNVVFSNKNIERKFSHHGSEPIEVNSPLGEEQNVLKQSLLPGLLSNVNHNLSNRRSDVRLFEIRPIFTRIEKNSSMDQKLATGVQEYLRLGLVATGQNLDMDWSSAKRPFDFYSMKGVVESLFDLASNGVVTYESGNLPQFLHPGQGAAVVVRGKKLGYLGQIHPQIHTGIDTPVYVAELDMEGLVSNTLPRYRYRKFGKYPQVERDFSVTVKDSFHSAMIQQIVMKVGAPLVQNLTFFDVYRGDRIPKGSVSYAFRVILASPDHTLTEMEIAPVQEKVMMALSKDLGAKFAGK